GRLLLRRCLFFFQGEDGIRCRNVTGVQTCALPICCGSSVGGAYPRSSTPHACGSYTSARCCRPISFWPRTPSCRIRWATPSIPRSEERRVGKEGRCRTGPGRRRDGDVEHRVTAERE